MSRRRGSSFRDLSARWIVTFDGQVDLSRFREWAETHAVRYAVGGVEYEAGRGNHLHVAVETNMRYSGTYLHGLFGGFWSNNEYARWEDMLEYIGSERAIQEYWDAHPHPHHGFGGAPPDPRDLGPYHANAGRGSDYVDGGLDEPGGDVGADIGVGPCDIVAEAVADAGIGNMSDIGNIEPFNPRSDVVEPDTQELIRLFKDAGLIQSQEAAVSASIDAHVQGSASAVISTGEHDNQSEPGSRKRKLTLDKSRGSKIRYTSTEPRRRSVLEPSPEEDVQITEETPAPSPASVRPIIQQSIARYTAQRGVTSVERGSNQGGPSTSNAAVDTRSANQVIRDTLMEIYGPRTAVSICLGRHSEDEDSRQWICKEFDANDEGLRRQKLIPYYWDMETKVRAKRILTVQGQKGRNAKEPNGVFREIAELLLRDPYIEFRHIVRLFPFYATYAAGFEQLKLSLLPPDPPAKSVINVWIQGQAGGGKTKLIHYFCKHLLHQQIYTLPQTERYKWWKGYVTQKVVHIEEMSPANKMDFCALKTLCDVTPVDREIKGGFTRLVRPLMQIFTSNYSPEAIYGQQWDTALQSRFSSERFLGSVPDHHSWSGDLIWTVAQTKAALADLYLKLRALFPQINENWPTTLPENVLEKYNDPPDWPNPYHVMFITKKTDIRSFVPQ